MKTRHATLIRKGILAARDPELSQYVHLGSLLVREAARREAVRIYWRQELADAHARRKATPTPLETFTVTVWHNRRVAIAAEQAECIRGIHA